jgi:hypothetical protein
VADISEIIYCAEWRIPEVGMAAIQTEELKSSHLAISVQPLRTMPPFSVHDSCQLAPPPMRLIVPLNTLGALLKGPRCLTASRPFSTRIEFRGKTVSRFLFKLGGRNDR